MPPGQMEFTCSIPAITLALSSNRTHLFPSSLVSLQKTWLYRSKGTVFIGYLLISNNVIGKGNGTPLRTLAWKIPWAEEPGRLRSMGLLGVLHDWATSLSLFTFMHWRRKWQATPVFLPGESQGRGSLVDCLLWGRTESDTTEAI